MSELAEVVQELIATQIETGGEGVFCIRCLTSGEALESLFHYDNCLVVRAQATLAAHEAELAQLVHERDVWRNAFKALYGENPKRLRSEAAKFERLYREHEGFVPLYMQRAGALDAVADLLEA